MKEEEKKISFKELVQVRKEEMQHMLPGFMTEVTDGTHTVRVESPNVFERSTFRMNQ